MLGASFIARLRHTIIVRDDHSAAKQAAREARLPQRRSKRAARLAARYPIYKSNKSLRPAYKKRQKSPGQQPGLSSQLLSTTLVVLELGHALELILGRSGKDRMIGIPLVGVRA
jgi:F0F1-type ATP synthase assembly protein I